MVIKTRYSPFLTRYSPFLTRYSTFLTRYSTFQTRYSPFLTRYSTFQTRYSTFQTRYSTFLTRYSPFLTRYSTFLTRYSPFLTRYSTFHTRNSLFNDSILDTIPFGILLKFAFWILYYCLIMNRNIFDILGCRLGMIKYSHSIHPSCENIQGFRFFRSLKTCFHRKSFKILKR